MSMLNSPNIVFKSAYYHLLFTHYPPDYFINKEGIIYNSTLPFISAETIKVGTI